MAACSAKGPGAASSTATGTHGPSGAGGSRGSTAGHGGAGLGSTGHGGAGGMGNGSSGNGGASGSTSHGNGGSDSGIFDALTDPIADAMADPMSGSRLKAYYRTGDDGSKAYIPYVWFDSQRNEDCAFQTAADGVSRCMPTAYATTQFTDAACMNPVVWMPTCSSPKYASYSDATQCPSLPHIYPVGAVLTTPTTVYFKSGNVCTMTTPFGTPGYAYYSIGAEIAPTTFVGSTLQHE
jgi:hypothetical protein